MTANFLQDQDFNSDLTFQLLVYDEPYTAGSQPWALYPHEIIMDKRYYVELSFSKGEYATPSFLNDYTVCTFRCGRPRSESPGGFLLFFGKFRSACHRECPLSSGRRVSLLQFSVLFTRLQIMFIAL